MMTLSDLRGMPHVSVSQLKTFMQCPKKYFLQYVDRRPPAFRPIALAFGTAWHAAVGHRLEAHRDGQVAPAEELYEVFRDVLEHEAARPGPPVLFDDEEAHLEQTIDAGIRMLDVFLERVSLPARVIGVEVPFVIELVDQLTGEVVSRPLIGAIDALVEDEHAACVVELKTAKRRWSSDQLDYDPQMTAYAMAARELGYVNPKLALVVATKTKTPDVQIERLVRHQNDERELVETAFTLERAIEAGVDTRVRGWACKTCPYSEACAA